MLYTLSFKARTRQAHMCKSDGKFGGFAGREDICQRSGDFEKRDGWVEIDRIEQTSHGG
jgi:hypothetical protein